MDSLVEKSVEAGFQFLPQGLQGGSPGRPGARSEARPPVGPGG